jgi:integrase
MGTHQPGKLAAVSLNKLASGWHGDGGSLYLFVRGNSRTWVFRYLGQDGRRKHMGLGSLRSVSLARARELARELRSRLKDPANPVDPLQARREAETAKQVESAKSITFAAAAEAYIEAHKSSWSNPKHVQQWTNTLTTYAGPIFGKLPVNAVDTALVMRCLEPLWQTKQETASRLRGRIEAVLDWSTVRGFREGDNPARWRGHLDKLLAPRKKGHKHHAALDFKQLPPFMTDLRKRDGFAARALEFAILTAARSGEVRGATWNEIDFDERLWIVPGSRMKAGKEHRVPLSDAAMAILTAMPREEDKLDGLIFTSPNGGKLSDMALGAVLTRMEVAVTAHGFRSTFRDWAAERTNHQSEVIEMALAHTIRNQVEAAYRRGDLLEKRRQLMNDWDAYCLEKKTGDVLTFPIKGTA